MNTAEWLETWFDLYVVPSKLAPSTVAMYRRSINAVPLWLGNTPLEQLSPVEVQRWLVTVARSTPRAAQLDRITITRAIKVARKSGLCSCLLDEDTLPHVQHNARKAEVLTREEAHAYLIAAQEVKCYPLLMLLLVCGLRRSEALGLKWSDLSEDGVLTIQRQRMRVNHRYTAAPLKTAQSNRQLLLPPEMVAILQAQPRSLTRWILDVTPEKLRADHQHTLAKAGITKAITLHGLRHTMAMLATAGGEPLKLLQSAMGHSTYKLTADLYTNHSFPPISTPTLVWQGIA